MPSFRDIPETLRPLAWPERDEPPSPPPAEPPPDQAIVDCGIYVDGARLPGTFNYAAARAKVAELQLSGQEAFAWIGLRSEERRVGKGCRCREWQYELKRNSRSQRDRGR